MTTLLHKIKCLANVLRKTFGSGQHDNKRMRFFAFAQNDRKNSFEMTNNMLRMIEKTQMTIWSKTVVKKCPVV